MKTNAHRPLDAAGIWREATELPLGPRRYKGLCNRRYGFGFQELRTLTPLGTTSPELGRRDGAENLLTDSIGSGILVSNRTQERTLVPRPLVCPRVNAGS